MSYEILISIDLCSGVVGIASVYLESGFDFGCGLGFGCDFGFAGEANSFEPGCGDALPLLPSDAIVVLTFLYQAGEAWEEV